MQKNSSLPEDKEDTDSALAFLSGGTFTTGVGFFVTDFSSSLLLLEDEDFRARLFSRFFFTVLFLIFGDVNSFFLTSSSPSLKFDELNIIDQYM